MPATAPLEYRYIFPEFLPDPNMKHRNKLREKLERADMIQRRKVLQIPEFYVGGCFLSDLPQTGRVEGTGFC